MPVFYRFSGCLNIDNTIDCVDSHNLKTLPRPTYLNQIMIIAQPTYLYAEPDFKAVLLNQLTLLAVAVPTLLQLPIAVSTVFVLFTFGRLLLLWLGAQRLPRAILLFMLTIVVVLVLLQVGTFIGLQGGMSLLLLLGSLKSFEGFSRRDWQVSALVQIFLLAGAVLFDQSLWVGIWVLMCLIMIANSLAVLNELSLKQAMKQSSLAFVFALLPMIVLFVAMPRKDAPLWGVPQNPTIQGKTGIPETMRPGSIGDLVQSNEPAFTATFNNHFIPKNKDLYWRVSILAQMDNTATWQTYRNLNDHVIPNETNQPIHYQIVLEDDKGKIPALDYPTNQQPRRGIMREAGDVLRVYSRQGVRGVQLTAQLSDQLPQNLNRQEYQLYTQLPENLNPKTRALAQQLWQQSNGNIETFIKKSYQYFQQQGFSYTLQPPILASNSPTDEFLFTSKRGFCEHYADAFVQLMRHAGVPARIVIGYQGGEWNGEFWQIRSKDAHAWTEVWLPESKTWQRIDPTAAVSANRIDNGLDGALPNEELSRLISNSSFFSRLADNSQIYWQRWVVNFDGAQQQNLFTKLGFDGANWQSILTILWFGLGIASLPIVIWWHRSRQQDFDPMQQGFIEFKHLILGKNFANITSLGAVELQHTLTQQRRMNPQIEAVLRDYINLNYAHNRAPNQRKAKKWYRRAKRIGKKYAISTK